MARFTAFSILFFFTAAFLVHALGIVSDYLERDTLEVEEGTSSLYSIRIQNQEEGAVDVKFSYDNTFLTLLDGEDRYSIPPKGTLRLVFNVTAPQVDGNQTHRIGYTVQKIGSEGSGMPILLTIGRNFDLKIVDSNPRRPWLLFAGGLLVAFVLASLVRFFPLKFFTPRSPQLRGGKARKKRKGV